MDRPVPAAKVIGLGGVGAVLAQALAQFLAHRRVAETLWLVDGDRYEERNRERVLFAEPANKALVKARELTRALDGAVPIFPVPEYVTPANVARVAREGEVIFLACDNHATRKLLSDRCCRLRDVVLISGGNDGVEQGRPGTFGSVHVHIRRGGRNLTNPLTRFHPEVARPADRRPDEAGCAALSGSAPQLLFTNLAVAAAMLGAFHAWLGGTLDWEELFLDIATGKTVPVRRAVERRRPGGAA